MNKTYTVEDFKPNFESREPIEATGNWSESNKIFDINYSSILTRLIQEAGRWCERYASDLFIDWKHIEKSLSDPEYKGEVRLFGFRESGVDHTAWVLNKYNNLIYDRNEYRAIWKLTVKVEPHDYYGKKISMELVRVFA